MNGTQIKTVGLIVVLWLAFGICFAAETKQSATGLGGLNSADSLSGAAAGGNSNPGPQPAYPSDPSKFPRYEGYVTDPLKMLRPEVASDISVVLKSLEEETGIRMALVMAPDIGYWRIENFAAQLFDRWNLGQNNKGQGVLMVVVRQNSGRYLPYIEARIPEAGGDVETWTTKVYQKYFNPYLLTLRLDYMVWTSARYMAFFVGRFYKVAFAGLEGADRSFPVFYPDYVNFLTDPKGYALPEMIKPINDMLSDLNEKTGVKFVVAVVDAPEFVDEPVYAENLFRRWGMKDRDALLLVSLPTGGIEPYPHFVFKLGDQVPGLDIIIADKIIRDVIVTNMRVQQNWQRGVWEGVRVAVKDVARAHGIDPGQLKSWSSEFPVPLLNRGRGGLKGVEAQQTLYLAIIVLILFVIFWRGPAVFFRLIIGDPRPGRSREWSRFGDQRLSGGFAPFGIPSREQFDPLEGRPRPQKTE